MSAGLCQTSKQHVQVSVTALDSGRWVVVVFAALCIYMLTLPVLLSPPLTLITTPFPLLLN